MTDVNELAERYVAVWNEPDPALRRDQIRSLWSEDGTNITPSLRAQGHAELADRIATAHDKWVRAEGMTFRSSNNAAGHHHVVKFNWQMLPADGGPAASVGFDFLILDEDGRIRLDYQFIESA